MKNNKSDYLQNKKVSLKPYIYEKPSISAVSLRILVLLLLQIVLLFFTKSFDAIIVIICSAIGSLLANLIHYIFLRKNNFMAITSLIQGILIGMLLPQNYPPVTALFISFGTLIIFKYVFESSENFWINIVSVSVLIAYFIGKSYFPPFQVTPDLFSLKNPTLQLINNGTFPVYDFDVSLTNFLNANLLNHFKVTLPHGILSMLWDTQSVIPAFRFNLLTIIASIVLFSDNSFSMLIPTIFLFTYAFFIRLFFPYITGGEFNQGDIILAMLTSGTLFVAVFLIQWFGTHPMTVIGKIIYAVIAGIYAFITVGCGTSPVGMIYVIIICNIFNLLIRLIEEKRMDYLMHKMTKMSPIDKELLNAGN